MIFLYQGNEYVCRAVGNRWFVQKIKEAQVSEAVWLDSRREAIQLVLKWIAFPLKKTRQNPCNTTNRRVNFKSVKGVITPNTKTKGLVTPSAR